jgi:chromosome segregation ATPase
VPRDEVEAAYFALLRARDEVADLQRYEEYLRAEAQRLHRTTSEGRALAELVDRRLRRRLRHSDEPLDEAVRTRLEVIADELDRLPDRLAAAAAHVEECERDYARLRG